MIGTLTVPEGSEKSLPMWSKTMRAARLAAAETRR
jgi:hypothetical protein